MYIVQSNTLETRQFGTRWKRHFGTVGKKCQIGTAFSFKYKLCKNWQTRAWDPVFKTAGFFCVPHQIDIATTIIMKRTGQGRKFFLQTPKSKIDKKHSYAIFPYKNNNHIFYDYSEINQKGPPVRKTWLK